MTQAERIASSARVFCVAAVLGLSLALLDTAALQGTLVLAAVAALAIGTDASSRIPVLWVVLAEGGIAALVVGMALPQGVLLLPYLVVPSLIAGVSEGLRAVLLVVAIEVSGLGLVLLIAGRNSPFEAVSEVAGPWLLTTLGVGLMGARFRSLRDAHDGGQEASYESARRLLTQLRTVARRLSSGLDTVTLASDLLNTVHAHLDDTHAAAFTRTDGGILAPIGYRGRTAKDAIDPEGVPIDKVLRTLTPASEIRPSGMAGRRHRTVLPLRVGSRCIGVVVTEGAAEPSPKVLATLMREVDEHALRLDAALAFDEIRSLATMQERQRLAREIHDGVAQEIASLGYVLDDLTASATSQLQRKKLMDLRGELSRVVSELRLSIFDLRTEVSAGLGSALSDYVREVGARSGIKVHTSLEVAPTRLRPEVETELFRIAQEAITNARKHSGARNLWVDCVIRPPAATISVVDDGRGLGHARSDSFGIKVMKERAERISATLDITSDTSPQSTSGTRVTVTVGDLDSPVGPVVAARGDHA